MLAIKWDKVKKGQKVYIKECFLEYDEYNGPFRIISPKNRVLTNHQDYWFTHIPEELYIKEKVGE